MKGGDAKLEGIFVRNSESSRLSRASGLFIAATPLMGATGKREKDSPGILKAKIDPSKCKIGLSSCKLCGGSVPQPGTADTSIVKTNECTKKKNLILLGNLRKITKVDKERNEHAKD